MSSPASPADGVKSPERKNKGKGKDTVASPDVSMEDDEEEGDEEEDDDDDDDAMEEDDDDDDEQLEEIDPSQIVGRRTRGKKVDYASREAHEKAGLTHGEEDEEE